MIGKEKIITNGDTYSSTEFHKDVWAYVEYLNDYGLKGNERALLCAENSYFFIVMIFALMEKGCSVVLVDPQMSHSEISHIATTTNSSICITNQPLNKNNGINNITLPIQGLNPSNCTEGIKLDKWTSRKDALILFSSGSTGKPKGIIKSGESFITNIRASMKRMQYMDNDVLQPLIPFTHFYGLSIVFIWWFKKCTIVLSNHKNIRSIIKGILEHDVTVIDTVPSTYYILIKLVKSKKDLLERISTSKMRMWCVGGAPLSQKLGDEFYSLFNRPLLDGYGTSEMGNIALNTSSPQYGCGTPLDSVNIKIVGDEGIELNQGEVGEIFVKSPGLMEGYFNLKDQTDQVLKNGWFRTNDLGFIDEMGNLFVIGRKGNEILRKGYLVYPASIEKLLEDQLAIKSKVQTITSEKRGSTLLLFVEGKEQERPRLRRLIQQTLNSTMKPDKVIFLDEFPLLPNGKFDQQSFQNHVHNWLSKQKGVKIYE